MSMAIIQAAMAIASTLTTPELALAWLDEAKALTWIEQRAVTRSREIEVNVAQTVNQNQVQAQAQAQAQQQTNLILSALQGLASQLNRSQQDIIAVGSKLYGIEQNSANTNVR